MNARALLVVMLLALACAATRAQCSHADFLHDLGMRESGLNPSERNNFGYVGLFQMGEAALQDAGYYRGDTTRSNDWSGAWTGRGGVGSLSEFMARPEVQVQAIVAYHNQLVAQISRLGLDRSIGSMMGGAPITLSGLVAGAHLVGIGNLQAFVDSQGTTVPRDGNGVPITSYITAFGGCEVGVSAPSYAAVVAANGGTGAGLSPVSPQPPGVPQSPPPMPMDANSAFAAASGRAAIDLHDAIAAMLATLLTLWLAWTAQSSFFAWSKRQASFFAMKAGIVRGCVLLCVVLVVLQ